MVDDCGYFSFISCLLTGLAESSLNSREACFQAALGF